MSGAGSRFVPKDDILALLMSMGYSRNAGTRVSSHILVLLWDGIEVGGIVGVPHTLGPN